MKRVEIESLSVRGKTKIARTRTGNDTPTRATSPASAETTRDFEQVNVLGLFTGGFPAAATGQSLQITSEFVAVAMQRQLGTTPAERTRKSTAELKAVVAMRSEELPLPNSERLPRGPHDMPREEVQNTQRRRILRALTEIVGEIGYKNTAVADVIRRAGVSRATFYGIYVDKEDCFFDAFETTTNTLFMTFIHDVIAPVEASGATGRERFEKTLDLMSIYLPSYLENFTSNEMLAKLYLVDAFAVGKRAVQGRAAAFKAVSSLLAIALYGEDGATPRRQEDVSYIMHGFYLKLTMYFGAELDMDLTVVAEQCVRMLRVMGASTF